MTDEGAAGHAAAGSYRAVLANRDMRLLVVGSGASQIGDWLYNVALLVYVFDDTRSAAWVAAATMGRLVPMALLSPLGGVVADRFERTRVLILSDLVRVLLMGGLAVAVLQGAHSAIVIALAALSTAAGVAYRPASGALVPDLAGEDNLAPANALLHTVTDVGVVAGPALGAVVLAVGSPGAAFAFNSLTFLVSALAASAMAVRSGGGAAESAHRSGPVAQFVDGMRAVRTTPYVPVMVFVTFLGAFTYGAQTVQLVLYAERELGLGADGYGYLLGATGAGGVLGATVSNKLASRPAVAVPLTVASVLFVGSSLLFAAAGVLSRAQGVVVAGVAVGVLSGLAMVVSDVVSEVGIARASDTAMLGRIFGAFDGLAVGGMVLGALIASPLVELTSLTVSLVAVGAVTVVAALACFPVLRRLDAVSAAVVAEVEPVVAVLERLTVLTGAPRRALEQLAAAAERLPVAAGTEVVTEGAPADAFFVVTGGRFAVTSAGERGAARFLRELVPGSYFGEIGLLQRIPRTATVTAVDDAEVLRIDGDAFLAALSAAPSGLVALSDGVQRGLALTHPSLRPAAPAPQPALADAG